MIKKDIDGDYVVTCDVCGHSDSKKYYDYRSTQELYEKAGWFQFFDGKVLCPDCSKSVSELAALHLFKESLNV